MKELVPTGTLRVGVAFAPSPSPLFVVKDAGGTPRGVTVDLANELANELGVALDTASRRAATRYFSSCCFIDVRSCSADCLTSSSPTRR